MLVVVNLKNTFNKKQLTYIVTEKAHTKEWRLDL